MNIKNFIYFFSFITVLQTNLCYSSASYQELETFFEQEDRRSSPLLKRKRKGDTGCVSGPRRLKKRRAANAQENQQKENQPPVTNESRDDRLTPRFTPRKQRIFANEQIPLAQVDFFNRVLRYTDDQLFTTPVKKAQHAANVTTPEVNLFKKLNPRVVVHPDFQIDSMQGKEIILSPAVRFLTRARRVIEMLENTSDFLHVKPIMFEKMEEESAEHRVKRKKLIQRKIQEHNLWVQTFKQSASPPLYSYELEVYLWKPFLDYFQERRNNFNGLKVTKGEYQQIFLQMVAPQYTFFKAGGSVVYYSFQTIDLNRQDGQGVTNRLRIKHKTAPVGHDGQPMELHHVHFSHPGLLVFISSSFHQDFTRVLHLNKNRSLFKGKSQAINRNDFHYDKQNDIFPTFYRVIKRSERKIRASRRQGKTQLTAQCL
jgi:hypothetical protein